ncbi:ATP-binding protein [Flavobacterium sp.]|jgi:predicted AAA+ superfamily ATPase|uniref:ATP-binding protein n=1 Tax=Flavobacterium sp. TaxID=239 RepID=UPI00391B5D72
MIQREAQYKLVQLGDTFKAIAVIGPRQSGKTTLVKVTFPEKPYLSLENPDTRNFALEDPRGFLQNLPNGAILDEVQRTPLLFSYLQEILDNSNQKGLFILTGSNNFLLQESISQSLAGRVGYLNLLPFSVKELLSENLLPETDEEVMVNGFYPPIYDQRISSLDWVPNYIKTYIERDVRQIKNVSDLLIFEKFMSVLAGRTSQELNLTSISNEVGVDLKTVQSWIGILESSFIIYLLKPHFQNYNKTIVKRPKVYFYDTGLVCSFLRISTISQLENHPLKGAIFETMVVIEMVKKYTNQGINPPLFYWRDKTGHEIDLIIDKGNLLTPIEIKSSKTINSDFFKNLKYWNHLSKMNKAVLIYSGIQEQNRSDGTLITNWKNISNLGF